MRDELASIAKALEAEAARLRQLIEPPVAPVKLVFMPVRRTDGREYLDHHAIAFSHDGAAEQALERDASCAEPDWVGRNPVVRIAAVELVEVPFDRGARRTEGP
jgi:hypothetical protein